MRSKTSFLSMPFLLLVLGLIFMGYSTTTRAADVTVPNVVGQVEASAKTTITTTCDPANVCLSVTVTYDSNTTAAAGTVISQTPAPSTSVAPTTTVQLVVSNSMDGTLTVPNVVGQAEQAGMLIINSTCVPNGGKGSCLIGSTLEGPSSTVPKGSIVSQDPPAGFQAPPSSVVKLVISSGPALLIVPEVIDKSQFDAQAAITNTCIAGTTQCLRVGSITFSTSEGITAGNVISQSPPSRTQVNIGTPVSLVISSGKAPITVPNVVGQTLTSAQTLITGAGFKVGAVSLTSSDTASAGTIISQNPSGGSQAATDSTINLIISSGTAAPKPPEVTPGNIEVPNVVGLAKTNATTIIRQSGLSAGAIIQKYDANVAAGTVIDQSPAAGAKVGSGVAVSLTVSLGPAGVIKVPDVAGLSAEAAHAVLQSAGLTIGNTQTQPEPTVPLNTVIKTNPVAGSQVSRGSAVDLIVSAGATQGQQCVVPDVTNQTVDDARQILFATCLSEIGSTTVHSHPTIPAGKVAEQVPAAGTLIPYNGTVNVVVSAGSQPPVTTPRVVGLALSDATIVLESNGLKVGFVSRQTSNIVPEGRIISQNPLMSASVPRGWLVNLVVSLGPVPEDLAARPQTSVPDVRNLTLAAATVKLIEAGLQVGLVSNQRNATVPVGYITGQSLKPETAVPVSSRVNLVVSYGPYAYSFFSGPAYITNHLSNTVAILDPDTNKIADNLPIVASRSGPSGVVVHPDGTKLYVTNRAQFGGGAGTVSVIDLTERKVITTIPVGVAPLGIALNPTGERLFVANEGSSSLTVINTSTNQPFIDLNVPNLTANAFPRGVATHPNPLRPLVYVTNRTVNSFSDDATNPNADQCDGLVGRSPVNANPDQCVGSLSIFDADLKMQVGSVAVGWAPEGVAVSPDGGLVYVANAGDRTISIMETVFNKVIGVITLDRFGGASLPLAPRGIAVSPDGSRLYVTDGAGNRLFVIDIAANHAVVDIIPVGKKPYGVAVSADSRRVYVANTDDNTVSVINPQNSTVIATVQTGLGPWAFGQFVGPLSMVATPVMDPPSTAYPGNIKVKITSATPGALIRYTTDGSTPTATSGTVIGNGQTVELSATTSNVLITLKAVAFKDTWADSDVAEGVYVVNGWAFSSR